MWREISCDPLTARVRAIPHPGLVVLDTPLLPYRPPDVDSELTDAPPQDVVTAFYRNIQREAVGQMIVMENTDPDEPLGDQNVDVVFTASNHGRYGFFPAT
ncbi:hypothetical protein BFL43_08380 [Williamsia sp. 1135]|nr:hypothetical protein BFL43_08380 [Williamsia sp. 1135]